jgi:5-(carboxyamino)imidazole ribonucleotide mutase
VPVGTMAIGGARNAGLYAVRILAAGDPDLRAKVSLFQNTLEQSVLAKDAALRQRAGGA